MKNTLLEELLFLQLREKQLKRDLDTKYYDNKARNHYFEELKKTQLNIRKVKFKLKMSREMKKNEESRENI
jgi:hypothetical protein